MEEIEVPTEHLHEEMHEAAHRHGGHGGDGETGSKWFFYAALTSALLAVFAAFSALLAGHHSNEAMIDQIRASDQWSYYQAKGIKSAVLSTKIEMLSSLGKSVKEEDREKVKNYKKEQDEISADAKEKEEASENHLRHHMVFARAVTLFQVAIGVAAISVLTRKKRFWFTSLAFGAIGVCFLIQGLLMA